MGHIEQSSEIHITHFVGNTVCVFDNTVCETCPECKTKQPFKFTAQTKTGSSKDVKISSYRILEGGGVTLFRKQMNKPA